MACLRIRRSVFRLSALVALFLVFTAPVVGMLGSSEPVYAQVAGNISVFESGSTADDVCVSVVKIGSLTYIMCRTSTQSSAAVRAMSGNSTVASFAMSSGSLSSTQRIWTNGQNAFVIDAGAVKRLDLSGSSLTAGASLTLTDCTTGWSAQISSSLAVVCNAGAEAGKIKIVGMSSMTLSSTLATITDSHGGNTCSAVQGIYFTTSTKGVVACDSTEAYLFTVSGSTITLTDSKTGLVSSTAKDLLITENAVWAVGRTGSVATQVASIDLSSMTFTSDFVSLPSNSAGTSLLVYSGVVMVSDATDNSIYLYDATKEQPSVATGQLGLGGHDVDQNHRFYSTDGSTFTIPLNVADTGRWLEITNFVFPLPSGGTTSGGNCSGGFVAVRLGTGVHCVSVGEDSIIDASGLNPFFPADGTTLGISGLPVTLAILMNVDEATGKIMAAAGAVLFLMSFIMIPAWKFGHSPPFFVWFIVIMFGVAISTVLGWIEPLYFAVMVVIAALGAGLKWSGAL